MDWIILLIIAYFLISLTSLVDKFLLTKVIPDPIVYVVFISTFGLAAFILAPFGLIWPNYWGWLATALAGGSFTIALFFFFHSLKNGEVSRVVSFTGALTAFLTYVFSQVFIHESLPGLQIVAFVLLLVGGIFITIEEQKKGGFKQWIGYGLLSACLFAVSYTATKYAYNTQGFITGIVLVRFFAFVCVLFFLLSAVNRRYLKASFKNQSGIRQQSNQILLIGAQVVNGLGFLLLNYIMSITNPALVVASQGLQYVFLLLITIVLSKKFPRVFVEKYTPLILAQKILAIVLIGAGLVLLAIYKIWA